MKRDVQVELPVAVANQSAGQLLSGLHELVAGGHHPHPGARNDPRLGHAHGGQEANLPPEEQQQAGEAAREAGKAGRARQAGRTGQAERARQAGQPGHKAWSYGGKTGIVIYFRTETGGSG